MHKYTTVILGYKSPVYLTVSTAAPHVSDTTHIVDTCF